MSVTRIVVPCYNEAERLDSAAFLQFVHRSPDSRFLFVDDGSHDATPAVLARLCAAAPDQLSWIRLDRNHGKAEAVRRGVLHAARAGATCIGYWDADLATPLTAISSFEAVLDARPEVLLVMGARVQLLGRRIRRQPARHYLGRMFATAASVTLGLPVYDTQCGAKLFRATPELIGVFEKPFLTKWIFDVEILARLVRLARGSRVRPAAEVVYELPLVEWCDVYGSKVGATDFVTAFADLVRIRLRYFDGRSPRVSSPADRVAAPSPASGAPPERFPLPG